jgi:hypothetical protein
MAVGADVVGTILSIVTSTTAPKALGEGRSRKASNWNVNKASGGR